MALTESQAKKVLDELLSIAKKDAKGAEVKATLTTGRSANTRFARNEITSTGDVDETAISVEVAFGLRHAETSTNQLDRASLRDAVARAARMARLVPEDPEHMPVLGAQRYRKAPGSFDAATARLDASVRADAARQAIAAAGAAKLDVAGFYEHSDRGVGIATSAGLWAWHVGTAAELTVTARTPDGTGSGWAGATSHRAAELEPASIAKVAIDKGVRSARPKRLEPGRYTVVLEPAAAGELFAFLPWAMNARMVDEGRSFFSRPGGGSRLGDKILGDAITVRSDPFDAAMPGAPMDDDGLPFEPTTWIDQGVVKQLIYNRYWAKKQGKKPTGRPRGTQLNGGQAASIEELIKDVKRGVLITRFWYTRFVDPQSILITGLTRDGVFLIENGQLTHPVNNFRFNESPIVMLKNADAMTRATVRVPVGYGALRVPAIRTHEFNLASISDAV